MAKQEVVDKRISELKEQAAAEGPPLDELEPALRKQLESLSDVQAQIVRLEHGRIRELR